MDPLSLVIGLAVGAVAAVVAFISQKKKADELDQRLNGTKDELGRLKKQTSEQLAALKASQDETNKALDSAKKKNTALDKAVNQQKEQHRKRKVESWGFVL